MPGKVNVYNLGEKGVNNTKSPIHMDDGELRSAQNGIFDPSLAEGGISKRFGMPRFNASALAGAVRGIIDVPLPSPGSVTKTLYMALDTAGANTWGSSADGVTWAYAATLGRAQSAVKISGATAALYYNQRSASFQRKLYYFGNDYVQYPAANHTAPPIRVYDGVNDYELFRVPWNPAAGSATNAYFGTDFCIHDGKLYFAVFDPGGVAPDHAGRVFELDPDTSIVTQVGNAFGNDAGEAAGGMPFCLCSHNGLLWAGTYGVSGGSVGRIYAIRVGIDLTWTLKVTTGVGAGYITSMVSYKGELYYGTQGDAGNAALLRKRDNAGTLTTIDTAPATTAGNYYGALIVYDGSLYATWSNLAGSAALIRKYDGTSVTTDRDVGVTDAPREVGQPFVYASALYIPFVATNVANADGFLLRKAAGAWTKPANTINVRGFFGRVDLVPS